MQRSAGRRRFSPLSIGIVLIAAAMLTPVSAIATSPRHTVHQRSPFAGALLLNPARGNWWVLPSPEANDHCQTVSALPGGRVLVAGGVDARGHPLKTTFVYDSATARWQRSGDMRVARCNAAGTLLPGGDVLVAGGETPRPGHRAKILSSTEIYNQRDGRWRHAPSLLYPLVGQAATGLANGDVLEVGGAFGGSALQYSVRHNHWIAVATEPIAGIGLTATPLPNGHVLIVGAITRSPLDGSRQTALLFDPVATSWSSAGSPGPARAWHTATALRSGQVLVAGGLGTGTVCSLYDPRTNSWLPTGSLHTGRFMASATVMANGKVLVTGGLADNPLDPAVLSTSEIYDPLSGAWSPGPAMPMGQGRRGQSAVLLPGKKVLIIGGTGQSIPPVG